MVNHYIRQDLERRMILFGWSEREIVDFINDTLERELMSRMGVIQTGGEALDSMVAKKRLNEPQKKHVRTWTIHSQTQQAVSYLVTLEGVIFSCTCPNFQFRGGDCKHIKRVKMKLAGERQKNKLPGVEP